MRPSRRQIGPYLIELYWDEKPNDLLLQHILSWELAIASQLGTEVLEIRKGFQTLTCMLRSDLNPDLQRRWKALLQSNINVLPLPDKVWEIPVCYDQELGKDLNALSKSKSISVEEVINLHTFPTYRIHFFGFLPGFMYLNGLDPALHFPRKSIPDRKIEPGSVAIGGAQTGIYPNESPGGWHVIGKTPTILFHQNENPPVFAKPGEQIKFLSIGLEEFYRLSKDSKPLKSND
ncbi:MAG: KipI family sensor histidine kinase inhibitor [Algoriphagus sp.]|jgi:KipI family sensor histidine kinase inhibitor